MRRNRACSSDDSDSFLGILGSARLIHRNLSNRTWATIMKRWVVARGWYLQFLQLTPDPNTHCSYDCAHVLALQNLFITTQKSPNLNYSGSQAVGSKNMLQLLGKSEADNCSFPFFCSDFLEAAATKYKTDKFLRLVGISTLSLLDTT